MVRKILLKDSSHLNSGDDIVYWVWLTKDKNDYLSKKDLIKDKNIANYLNVSLSKYQQRGKKYNGKIKDGRNIIFNNKENCKEFIDWINSIILNKKLNE
jgi:hypothetical protein